MLQAFAYRHLVPAREFKVFVTGHGSARAVATIRNSPPVKIPAGGSVRLEVDAPVAANSGIELELAEPPEGISIRNVSAKEILLQGDGAKAKAGLKGNLILNAIEVVSVETADETAPPAKRRTPLGLLPALPFEVVGP